MRGIQHALIILNDGGGYWLTVGASGRLVNMLQNGMGLVAAAWA
jgi:hypothetical protein